MSRSDVSFEIINNLQPLDPARLSPSIDLFQTPALTKPEPKLQLQFKHKAETRQRDRPTSHCHVPSSGGPLHTSPEEYHGNSSTLARTAAHDVRTGAHTNIPRSETRTKTTSLSANTPMTSAEWCQAKQEDPAAVSLALATRDLIGMNMGVNMQEGRVGQNTREEEEEEEKEEKKMMEEERLKKKKKKKKKKKSTKKGWDEEKHGHSRRVFEWIPSPGPEGLQSVPEEFVKGTVSR
ncbi:hypothetical protein QR685DRAFT_545377 [Neurospora intermedia]|uniref:Uncharacterized protein n=1 Tax=Neurospora intermedia TaxID=5142 RepID=A0ABR3DCA0_NEUIN